MVVILRAVFLAVFLLVLALCYGVAFRQNSQALVESLDAHSEFAILKANFSGAPRCKSACNIVLQHNAHQGSAHSGQYNTSASGKGRPDAFFPEQMPLTALNALPMGRLPAGTHQLHILCDKHTACAPRPHLIQLQRQELSAHVQLDIAEGVDEACNPAATCVRIAAADESPWVKELATEIKVEHRTASGGLLSADPSLQIGPMAVYGLYTVLVAGKAAAGRLAKAARCWVIGMGWVLAIRVVYAS